MNEFYRIKLLPQYIFNQIGDMKLAAKQRGEDIIDFGMGNPDQPTPSHIVEALVEASKKPENHRYSLSRGITDLRRAICNWYAKQYDINLNPESEAIVTIGSKEGIAHLALAVIAPQDVVLVPNPTYPIHTYAFVIAGADVRSVKLLPDSDPFESIREAVETCQPKPKFIVLNFPSNPTTQCVDSAFFERIVQLAKKYQIWVLHDLAYADIVFDHYKAPSILQVKGAKDVAIECYTLSKSYNMPGWRVGFMCGNEKLIAALARMKSYLDYGMFTPIQLAAIEALEGPQDCVKNICDLYKQRRDVLCHGLNQCGWEVTPPLATMFVWAKIPAAYQHLGSFEFAKLLLNKTGIGVSPGIGFGSEGDQYVRFSLIEDEKRTLQAIDRLQNMFLTDGFVQKKTEVIGLD